jgi:hypothetical protein
LGGNEEITDLCWEGTEESNNVTKRNRRDKGEWKRAKGETKRMGLETKDEIMFSVSRRI